MLRERQVLLHFLRTQLSKIKQVRKKNQDRLPLVDMYSENKKNKLLCVASTKVPCLGVCNNDIR